MQHGRIAGMKRPAESLAHERVRNPSRPLDRKPWFRRVFASNPLEVYRRAAVSDQHFRARLSILHPGWQLGHRLTMIRISGILSLAHDVRISTVVPKTGRIS